MSCPICRSENPTWPVAEGATGWTFCGDCYRTVQAAMQTMTGHDEFADFLRAIALCREERRFDDPPTVSANLVNDPTIGPLLAPPRRTGGHP